MIRAVTDHDGRCAPMEVACEVGAEKWGSVASLCQDERESNTAPLTNRRPRIVSSEANRESVIPAVFQVGVRIKRRCRNDRDRIGVVRGRERRDRRIEGLGHGVVFLLDRRVGEGRRVEELSSVKVSTREVGVLGREAIPDTGGGGDDESGGGVR